MTAEVHIVHRYPVAERFLRHHGVTAVAVLHDLLRRAELVDGDLVVTTTVRAVASRVGCLSKDTVHRAVQHLVRTAVLEPIDCIEPGDLRQQSFRRSTYRVRLDGTGIECRTVTDDAA